MKIIQKINEHELDRLAKKVINGIKHDLITEQISLLNLPFADISFGPGSDEKKIMLKAYDRKLKKNLTLTYEVLGEYKVLSKKIPFSVELRNIKRLADGSLYVEAKPTNWVAQVAVNRAMEVKIPDDKQGRTYADKNMTEDGYLKSYVTKENLEDAINKLKKNARFATIDAGNDVYLTLKLVK